MEDIALVIELEHYATFVKALRERTLRETDCFDPFDPEHAGVRRKFFDVHAAQGSAIAAEALERIATLYAIEKEARGQPPENRVAIRQVSAAPRLDELEQWLQAQLPRISAKTPLAAAIRHARKGCQRKDMDSFLLTDTQMPVFKAPGGGQGSDALFTILLLERPDPAHIGIGVGLEVCNYGRCGKVDWMKLVWA